MTSKEKKMQSICIGLEKREVLLPKWLDELLFDQLSARYCQEGRDMLVLKWSLEKLQSYLGTYFPRSYVESYCVFSELFNSDRDRYAGKDQLSIFDFGCGTGGELIGLLVAISETLPEVKEVEVVALDGNAEALRFLDIILKETSEQIGIKIKPISPTLHLEIDDFYDMEVTMGCLIGSYDIVLTFKAVCEFVSLAQFDDKNAYQHLLEEFVPKLKPSGIICIADISSYSDVGQDWLPNMLERASDGIDVKVIARNQGHNRTFRTNHRLKKGDPSKIAYRIYERNNN